MISAEAIASELRELICRAAADRAHFLGGGELEAVLDARDQPAFEHEWIRIHALIVSLAAARPSGAIEEERRVVYESIYAGYQSPDLAACVSDDVELIACALADGIDDAWLRALHRAYRDGRFPTGALEMP